MKRRYPFTGPVTLTRHMELTGNRLLDSADEHVREALLAIATRKRVEPGLTLSTAHVVPKHLYLPVDTALAQLVSTPENKSVAVGLLGKEDIANCFGLLGSRTSSASCVALEAGRVYSIPLPDMQRLFETNAAVRNLIHVHLQFQMAMHDQLSACNTLHEIQPRLVTLLLSLSDQLGKNSFTITQELLSAMLGVMRSSININAIALSRLGIIRYARGAMTIVDKDRLKTCACSCYPALQKLVREMHEAVAGPEERVLDDGGL